MTTITTFLLDRITEDETVARATLANFGLTRDLEGPMLAHVAHFDPARILTECEAKRRIVKMWADRDDDHLVTAAHRTGLGLAIKALAQVYADHPSFDPTWNN